MPSPQPPDRLRLRGFEALVHFILPVVSLAVTLAVGFLDWKGTITVGVWVIPALAAATFSLALWRFHLLRFIEVPNGLLRDQAREQLREAARSVGWREEETSDDSRLVFSTKPNDEPPYNNGERITAVVGDRVVYINCINDPADWVQPFSGSEIRANVEWLVLILEQGVWTYSPKQPIGTSSDIDASRTAPPLVQPPVLIERTGEKYHDVLVELWKTDRAEVRTSMWKEVIIAFFTTLGIVGLFIGGELLAKDFDPVLIIWIVVIIALATALRVLYSAMVGTRYLGVRTDPDDVRAYDSLKASHEKTGWTIGFTDPDLGIVADIPYLDLKKGAIAAFHFRGDVLYFNVFDDADRDDPISASIVQRIAVLDWILRWARGLDEPGVMINGVSGLRALRVYLHLARRSGVADVSDADRILDMIEPREERPRDERHRTDYYLSRLCGDLEDPRVQLSGYRFFAYYFLSTSAFWAVGFALILFLGMMGGWVPIETKPTRFFSTLLLFSLSSAFLEVIMRHVRRRMKRYTTGNSAEENYRRICSKLQKWEWVAMKDIPDVYLEIFVDGSYRRHEMVSILFSGNDVWISSINTPETWHNLLVEPASARTIENYPRSFFGSTYSWSRNRHNRQMIIDLLLDDPNTQA